MNKLKIFLEMIKFEHTVFALPFAFLGAILGAVSVFERMPTMHEIFWIIIAMIGARTAAMGLNRLIDRAIDAKNPRTANRAIPAGKISSKEVIVYIIISFALLFIAASQLSPLAMKLLPIAVFFTVFYSYTKRFTWLCHVVLGITLGLAPLGGWVAITGQIDWTAMILYTSVVFWSAGFDIIYACQDYEFDKREGLYSIPARFGIAKALGIAKLFHVIPALGFTSLLWLTELRWLYGIGVVIALVILFYQHRLVTPTNLSRLDTAFFTMNGTLSVVVFAFGLADLVVLGR
jgi:4-hydroxybenzoate polyprenyltransferase